MHSIRNMASIRWPLLTLSMDLILLGSQAPTYFTRCALSLLAQTPEMQRTRGQLSSFLRLTSKILLIHVEVLELTGNITILGEHDTMWQLMAVTIIKLRIHVR